MELAFLIGGLLIGACLILTIQNTVKVNRKKQAPEDTATDEQKRREEEFSRLMNYRGE